MLGNVLRNSKLLATTAARNSARRMSTLKDINDVKVKDVAGFISEKIKEPATHALARVRPPMNPMRPMSSLQSAASMQYSDISPSRAPFVRGGLKKTSLPRNALRVCM
jgi:hypothetical protein